MPPTTKATGRGWAYTAGALGAAVSIAANIGHSYVPPAGTSPSWRPQVGAVLLAAFWPVAVVLAVEVLARVDWPGERRWAWLRWGGLVPVAAVAAVVSYRHLSGLLAYYGEDAVTVALGPLAVDGLMVVATGALLALSRQGRALAASPVTAPARPDQQSQQPDDGHDDRDQTGDEQLIVTRHHHGAGRRKGRREDPAKKLQPGLQHPDHGDEHTQHAQQARQRRIHGDGSGGCSTAPAVPGLVRRADRGSARYPSQHCTKVCQSRHEHDYSLRPAHRHAHRDERAGEHGHEHAGERGVSGTLCAAFG